jgi:hypothetical protein
LLNFNAQINIENNRLKLEVEPALYFYAGRSISGLYSVTKDNNFGIGFYMMSTEIPDAIASNMFKNYDAASSTAKITQQFSLNFRYRFKISKKFESNPYFALMIGAQNISIESTGKSKMNVGTGIITPLIGYEFYMYKKMIYFNPQLRFANYIGSKKSDETRPETLRSMLLPGIIIGYRF